MNQHFWKYIAGLLIFGSNGIVASHIDLNSYEIVYLRSGIGGMALVLFFLLMRQWCFLRSCWEKAWGSCRSWGRY